MAETNLHLPNPRKASGEPIYTLLDVARAQFESVVLNPVGKPDQKISIITKTKEGEVNVGSANMAFVLATLISCLSGRGDVPDGLTCFVNQHAGKMAHLDKYEVLVRSSARGGTYSAPFSQFLAVAKAKAQIVVPSLEKWPLPKRVRNKATEDLEPEAVDAIL